MNIQKPSIPKGTRDFSRKETAERNYIFDTIRSVFKRYGYAAIETPAMENLSTLLGKYGDEGDKLLYRILDSGDPFADADFEKPLTPQVCSKGLRYDLTVPFARYVVQHQGELTFPFKRFQMQPVWRADRPQKGRYREFWQCDVDVIGTPSQLCELELTQIIDAVFRKLDVRVEIRLNNRKVLTGLAEVCGCPEQVTDLTVAIDKLEKIGIDAVKAELVEKGIGAQAFATLEKVLQLSGSVQEKIAAMRELFAASEVGLKGLDELEELFGFIRSAGIQTPVALDLSLARGLNYYTGAIFEVKALDWQIGSICGGGRYDNLTGIFGLPGMSGVGVSFGADRIYDVLKGLEKFPDGLGTSARLLFANMGAAEVAYILPFAAALRERGIAVEVYPDSAKLRKQFEYADRQGIPFLSINGSDEAAAGRLTVKNLASGEQRSFDATDLAALSAYIEADAPCDHLPGQGCAATGSRGHLPKE